MANRLRPAGWTSADAAGLPIFAGLLRYDEVKAGSVDRAIRMTVGMVAVDERACKVGNGWATFAYGHRCRAPLSGP